MPGAPLSTAGAPLTLLNYGGPASNDAVTIGVRQSIGSWDALRTSNQLTGATLRRIEAHGVRSRTGRWASTKSEPRSRVSWERDCTSESFGGLNFFVEAFRFEGGGGSV